MTTAPGANAPARVVGIGDNIRAFAFDEKAIDEQLKVDHKEVVERALEIDDAYSFRMPKKIEDEETAARVTVFAAQCGKALRSLKSTEAEAIVPYQKPVAIVKAFFARLRSQVEAADTSARQMLADWDKVKRARIQAQAWRPAAGACLARIATVGGPTAQELAHLKMLRLVDDAGSETPLGRAEREAYIRAEEKRLASERAAQEERAAAAGQGAPEEAPPPPPAPAPPPPPIAIPTSATTVRSDLGASSSVRTVWKPVIVNPDLVPRQYCEPSQVKLNAAAKLMAKDADNKPIENIPGVEWQAKDSVTVRG